MKRTLFALVVAGCGSDPPPRRPAPASSEPVVERMSLLDGLAEDATAAAVFERAATAMLHPRCTNCHPQGDRPHVEDGTSVHAMNVARGEDDRGSRGLPCDACHQSANAIGTRAPPGAPKWHLSPRAMGFAGKTARGLCAHLKDPQLTGGRDVPAIIEHIDTDPLVAWAWNPGHDRTPPPGTKAELVALLRRWETAGAPCP